MNRRRIAFAVKIVLAVGALVVLNMLLTPAFRCWVGEAKPIGSWSEWGAREYGMHFRGGVIHVLIRENGKVADVNTHAPFANFGNPSQDFSLSVHSKDKLLFTSANKEYWIEKHEGRWCVRSASTYKVPRIVNGHLPSSVYPGGICSNEEASR